MKYFRSYPWGMQLLMFVLMVFTFMSATAVLILSVLPKMSGFTALQITSISANSPAALVNAAIIVAGIGNLFNFCIPALLFAYLSTPRPAAYIGLRRPGKMIQLLFVGLVIAGAIPILQMIEGLVSLIDFGAKIKESQKVNDDMFSAFMNMPDFTAFIKIFFLMAIIPGMGEELFFRGVLMRFAKKRSRNMVFPVLFTATIFAMVHTTVYGFVSIFLAGVLLAVIYYLTGSLWCSIVGHILFNGLQIILSYAGNSNVAIKRLMETNSVPYYLLFAGIIVFSCSFYFLWKNRTPLPPNWTDDFTPEELSQKAY